MTVEATQPTVGPEAARAIARELFDMQWFTREEFQTKLTVGSRTFRVYIAEGIVPPASHSMGQHHVWKGRQVREVMEAIEAAGGVKTWAKKKRAELRRVQG